MLHGDIGSQGTTPYHPANASVNANTQWEPPLRVVGPLFLWYCFVRQFHLVPLTTRYLTYFGTQDRSLRGLAFSPCQPRHFLSYVTYWLEPVALV